MRLRIVFVIEEGEAALKQVAACIGFANSMGINPTVIPELDPKKDKIARHVGQIVDDPDDDKLYKHAIKVLPAGSMKKIDFVRAFAKSAKKNPKTAGLIVKRWIKQGYLIEAD